jgi:hypothetical protein
MLANVSGYDVRDAINRGELQAFPAVDGTGTLLVRFVDAMAWALEQLGRNDDESDVG